MTVKLQFNMHRSTCACIHTFTLNDSVPICGKIRTITETELYLLIVAKVQFTRIFMYLLGTS